MDSYADVAAKGPKQTPEEAAAPAPTQVSIESVGSLASTSSLVDVDMPSVHTVPHDFNDQDVKTDTQAGRIKREKEEEEEKKKKKQRARAEADQAEMKTRAGAKAGDADSWLQRQFASLGDGTASALVFSNLVAVIGLSGFLGYKAWGLYERGRLSWRNIGLGLGILGIVGVAEGVFGSYLYKTKGKKN